MKNIEDIKIEALKSNEYYNDALDKVKELIRQNVLSMSTKEEQIKYVLEEKNRYRLLKESKKGYSLVALIIAISSLVSVILLNILKDNIVFFVLWLLAIVILISAAASYIVMSLNANSIKYTIILMAYEEIEKKLNNGIETTDNEKHLKSMVESLKESVEVIEEQLKMIYTLQKEASRNNKK